MFQTFNQMLGTGCRDLFPFTCQQVSSDTGDRVWLAGWGAGFCFCCQLTVRAHPEPTAGGPRGNSRWILEKVQWIKIVYCPFKVGGNVCATLWRTWTVIWRFSYNICTMKTLTNITYALDNKTEIWLDNTNRRIIPLAKYRIISIMATEHTFRKVSYIYV